MLSRRTFLNAVGAGAAVTAAHGAADTPKKRLRLAILTTVWRDRSHAWHMGERFLAGYPVEGRWHRPPLDVVSAYVDQTPKNDLSRDRAKEFGFKIYPTVAEALRQGTDKLAQVTFQNETATGWQTAQLSTPVTLTPGTTYVVSYLAPKGNYAYTTNGFASAVTSGPLTAPGGSNGRYLYGSTLGAPTFTYQASNYFVDVVFKPAAATSGGGTGLPAPRGAGGARRPRGVESRPCAPDFPCFSAC